MAGRVEGKVALVTGGASGLGAESGRRLAREGAKVVLTDLAAEAGQAVADEILAAGGEACFLTQDVTDDARWAEVVAATMARHGRIDVLVNSAGVADGGQPILEATLEVWRRIVGINLDGTFLGVRHVAPIMVAQGGGSVVNLSSILGKVGLPGASAYCASKGGVALLTKAVALELAPAGVRINSVHPGFIETPMVWNTFRNSESENEMRDMIVSRHALGRLGMAREIADAIVFLASDESSFMTGSELVIDGGYTAA
ncbi:SDR family NAD(P)-dependent oxidoreductase [Phenylobacterium sp.]|uniref:SDR family NAD(P)-dependent oxidoreductase n=1 Tax=Phenylobacterium sp. TaxID=1871053 RepID=UPI0025DE438A|nr:glucose 1-dehydrogenase [Phenylobacterium sp.]MBX3485057.1 glucose 1-dehydrogenase [Phenylobacterium sp.]MCW5758955.1 glucose 1-dehydrogenase [Phenylobacterium sp.]